MARLTRRSFRRRTSLSKYESALEAALKEKEVVDIADTAPTLDSIPDIIMSAPSVARTVDIVVPASAPIEAGRVVRVVNKGVDALTVSVNGVASVDTVAASSSADFYIADSTAAVAPVKL